MLWLPLGSLARSFLVSQRAPRKKGSFVRSFLLHARQEKHGRTFSQFLAPCFFSMPYFLSFVGGTAHFSFKSVRVVRKSECCGKALFFFSLSPAFIQSESCPQDEDTSPRIFKKEILLVSLFAAATQKHLVKL